MPLSDWRRRWWLRSGEVAAHIDVPGRPTAKLVFDYDDGNLWGFKLFTFDRADEHPRQPLFDHKSHAFAFGLDRDSKEDQPYIDAVHDLGAKLMGAPQYWILPNEQLAVLNVIAAELPNGRRISGRRLRANVKKNAGISDADQVEYLTKQLEPRYLKALDDEDGDYYEITLPGLMKSEHAARAKKVILSVMTVCDVKYNGIPGQEGDPDFHGFRLDDLMAVKELDEGDRGFALHAVDVLMLGTHDNTNAAMHVQNPGWIRPADVEHIANAKTLQDFWRATRKQKLVERPWPTAPLRLEETVKEARRRAVTGEPDRPVLRGVSLGLAQAARAPSFPMADTAPPPNAPPEMPRAVPDMKEVAPVKKKYDVALSFAGEDRPHAAALAGLVKNAGFQVFYDEYEQADLWGVNLTERLHQVYGKEARFVVMFASKHYAQKLWPTAERRAAQEAAFKNPNHALILPVVIDKDVEIPGLVLATTGYADINWGIPRIADLLFQKLAKAP